MNLREKTLAFVHVPSTHMQKSGVNFGVYDVVLFSVAHAIHLVHLVMSSNDRMAGKQNLMMEG